MPVPSDWANKLRDFVDEWKRNPRAEEYIGDNPLYNFVLAEPAASWDDFLNWVKELQGPWCFRGQREAAWSLLTTLDRAVKRYQPPVRKPELGASCRTEFLKRLREMNIHRASLFPGLDGFAQSLGLDLELKP